MVENKQETNQTSKPRHWILSLNPVVSKHWLLIVAGCMWTGVGILLSFLAVTWLAKTLLMKAILLGLLGIVFSFAINRFQFTKLAMKNIKRILSLNDKACVFSFQAWTGYLIIAFMMSLGIYMRNSAIPKPYLAVLYIAIGGSLLQASWHYYRHFFQVIRTDRR